MTTTTEAAVLTGPGEIKVQEFPIPEIGPDEGLLQIESCGICGSDIEPFRAGGGRVGAFREIRVPVILGHEMVGRIERVGARAAERWNVREGDRVVVERWMPCGRCAHCQRGAFPYCVRRIAGEHLFYGGTPSTVAPGLWGGFARHMYLHPDSLVQRVDAAGPASVYSMFLPLANAIDWVHHTGGLGLGGSILIQGPGPIGLIAARVAQMVGAQLVIVSGRSSDAARLALAEQLGATHTVVADETDVAERCNELTDGRGVDLVLDVTSAPSLDPLSVAVRGVRSSGTIVMAADHARGDGGVDILNAIQHKTLTVKGVRGRGRPAAALAIDLLVDRAFAADLKRLCEPIVGLDHVTAGFRSVIEGEALHASVAPSLTRLA